MLTADGVRDWNAKMKKVGKDVVYEYGYKFEKLPIDPNCERKTASVVPTGIYECNQYCECDKSKCQNRVTQRGVVQDLAVIYNWKGKTTGWGVYAKRPIDKGTFIIRYLGELITKEEELERTKQARQKATATVREKDIVEFQTVAYNVSV